MLPLLLAAAVLAACGGGGDEAAPPVNLAPTVALSFIPLVVVKDEDSTLRVTLQATSMPADGVNFSLIYPAGLVNGSSPGTTTCTSGAQTLTAASGGNSLALGNGRIPADGSCTVEVAVHSAAPGTYTVSLAAGALSSSQGSNTSAATASLSVAGTTLSHLSLLAADKLKFLNPDQAVSGTNPAEVSGGVSRNFPMGQIDTVYAGTVVPATAGIEGIYPARKVFIASGSLYVSDMLLSATSTAPRRISTLTNLCELDATLHDFVNPDHSWALVERAGVDNMCSPATDNTFALVRLDMPATATALTALGLTRARPVHGSNGAIAGFLTREANALVRRDANFTNPQPVTALEPGSFIPMFVESGFDRYYFVLQPAGAPNQQIYSYDVADGVFTKRADLSFSPVGNRGDSSLFVLDTQNIYFAEHLAVRRLPHAGGPPQTLTTITGGYEISGLMQTANRIVVNYVEQVPGSFTQSLATIDKAANDGARTVLVTVDQSVGVPQLYSASTSGRIYTNASGTAITYAETGGEIDNRTQSVWAGVVYSEDIELSNRADVPPSGLVLSTMSGANTQVDLFNAETGSHMRRLGTLPTSYRSTFGSGIGRYLFISAQIDRSGSGVGPFDNDLYFADTATADTAAAVATVSGVNEFSVLTMCAAQCSSLNGFGGQGF